MKSGAWRISPLCACLWLCGCASIPRGTYGVEELTIEGADQLAEGAIKRCLLTMERDRFGLTLGFASPDCQAPPFDSSPPEIALWSWPWSDWGELNPAVVDVDRERIERFYRARGFYDARVVEVRYDPPAAENPGDPGPDGCDPKRDECTVNVTFVVEEGEPLAVGEVVIDGLTALPEAVRATVSSAELPEAGTRFDERAYDRGKTQLAERLAEASYAGAKVRGRVQLDHEHKLAHVHYVAQPGPAYRFGAVRVAGQGGLPTSPIVAAAGIERGRPFRQSAIDEVQQEVYALGAFSSVEVERVLNEEKREVDLEVQVKPLDPNAFRLGIGVTSGVLQRAQSQVSVAQWDMHLLGSYERRHVLGTLGKLRIEERPRLIFKKTFPGLGKQQLGNVLRLRWSEPGLVEARTELAAETIWDYGPDPFEGFLRSDIILQLSAERAFLRRLLFARLGLQQDFYIVPESERALPDGVDPTTLDEQTLDLPPASYEYMFVEENLRLDLRDDQVQPHAGALLLLNLTQSVRSPMSDWTLLSVAPDARVFVPLPFGMTLALRFAVAALFILDAEPKPVGDRISETLGPQSYRLRGGGAQSNRGFVAATLGVGDNGGIRRWEASSELRVRLGQNFGVATFLDLGNVTATSGFGFDEPNPAVGFGLRYLTVVGTIRGDLGFRLHHDNPPEQFGIRMPDAVHVTIGEAF